MPLPRSRLSKSRRHRELTFEQLLELQLGPVAIAVRRDKLFADDDDRAAAWAENRDQLLVECWQPGSRPWAFWHFEVPSLADPDLAERRLRYLIEQDLLGDDEAALLLRWGDDQRDRLERSAGYASAYGWDGASPSHYHFNIRAAAIIREYRPDAIPAPPKETPR